MKIVFYILSGLSLIFGTVVFATDYHNRIVVGTVFLLVSLIFGAASLFLKPFESPELNYSIRLLGTDYKEGVEVSGIIWEKGFKEYFLTIENKNKKAEVYDLRIDIDMLGGIVKYDVFSQEGCEKINFSQDSSFGVGVGKKNVIEKTFKSYSNNLKIGIGKLYPNSHCKIKLIIKYHTAANEEILITINEGIFITEYRYLGAKNESQKKIFGYKILTKDKNSGLIYIDTENPIKGKHERTIMMTPAHPLIFKKDGSIEIEE